MNELKKIEKLYRFIYDHLEELNYDGGVANGFEIPKYDLYARDYLEFTENQIKVGTIESKINCVSNLKRAVDCQIDTFLFTLSLQEIFRRRNLKFQRKLELIEAIGVFNSNSLTKLNKIRNKMEHEYRIPEVNELDLYFDLVSAFISNLESAMTVLMWDEKDFYIEDSNSNIDVYFTIKFIREDKPIIIANWRSETDEKS